MAFFYKEKKEQPEVSCQVFTPDDIVETMLDQVGYQGEKILCSTIFEPSFGDGAFLVAIIKRILQYSFDNDLSEPELHQLLDNVYGMEMDDKYYTLSINKLDTMIGEFGITHNWKNIMHGNTLRYTPEKQFDLCIGNPPYLRNGKIDEWTRNEIEKNYKFCKGTTDLYIIFFEYCMRNIKADGQICFITPVSYFKNSSQAAFRKHLANNGIVSCITDFQNVSVFPNTQIYTAITLLDFKKECTQTRYTLMRSLNEPEYTVNVNMQDFGNLPWAFGNDNDYMFLSSVASRATSIRELCDIQYGVSTNADKVYVISKDKAKNLECELLRPVVKASKLNADNMMIFPYEWIEERKKYEVIKEEKMKMQYPHTYQYLLDNKKILEKRNMEKNCVAWYQYARSQSIQNVDKKKIVIKHILHYSETGCKIMELNKGEIVYSGIYFTIRNNNDYGRVLDIIKSSDFHRYLYLLGKVKAGGYREANARSMKEYRV